MASAPPVQGKFSSVVWIKKLGGLSGPSGSASGFERRKVKSSPVQAVSVAATAW